MDLRKKPTNVTDECEMVPYLPNETRQQRFKRRLRDKQGKYVSYLKQKMLQERNLLMKKPKKSDRILCMINLFFVKKIGRSNGDTEKKNSESRPPIR